MFQQQYNASPVLGTFYWGYTRKGAVWNIGLVGVEFQEPRCGLPSSGVCAATTFAESRWRETGEEQHWCDMGFCCCSNLNFLSPSKKPQPQVLIEHICFHPAVPWHLLATRARLLTFLDLQAFFLVPATLAKAFSNYNKDDTMSFFSEVP